VFTTEAWILDKGPQRAPGAGPAPARLRLDRIDIPDPGDDEVLVEPILGSWEGNLGHAISRWPVDICQQRGEPWVILGNGGVVRVLRPGPRVTGITGISEGDLCLIMPSSRRDHHGYTEQIFAYDCPRTFGILARRTKIAAELLLPLPRDTSYTLPQWTTYGRYFTAWDNWRVAYNCWRAQLEDDEPADHLVLGWGGGTTLAELELARRHGFRVAMTASSPDRLDTIERSGVIAIDRGKFPDLAFDADLASRDPAYVTRYRSSEKAFLAEVDQLSDGQGVSLFLDNIGGTMYKTTLKSLGRQAVLSTVGWKDGMHLMNVRATECIKRHLHVHTHAWRHDDSSRIRDFEETSGWIRPAGDETIYPFEDIQQLADDYAAGQITSYFPIFHINPL
jgi:NADPH:quinone reductase-like Zn-dependent oxidoreductase